MTLKIYFYPKENFQVLNRTKELIQDQGEILLKKWILTFFFSNKILIKKLNEILGINWRVLDYKFVVGMPDRFIPTWVINKCKGIVMTPNLGAFFEI